MVYWTEEDFKEIFGRYQESGLSIREFCNREGILEGRFHHWWKKLDREQFLYVLSHVHEYDQGLSLNLQTSS